MVVAGTAIKVASVSNSFSCQMEPDGCNKLIRAAISVGRRHRVGAVIDGWRGRLASLGYVNEEVRGGLFILTQCLLV